MVKYVANIHGDEAVTRELLLGLAQHLVWNFGTDQRVTHLLNKTEVKDLPVGACGTVSTGVMRLNF